MRNLDIQALLAEYVPSISQDKPCGLFTDGVDTPFVFGENSKHSDDFVGSADYSTVWPKLSRRMNVRYRGVDLNGGSTCDKYCERHLL